MSQAELLKQAKDLPVAERLDLIDQLIESVEADSPEAISAKDDAELDRRYRAYLANPDEGEPWEVFRARLERSLEAAKGDRPA
jgi:putative addiction module component (TIGR02574 family)